MSETKWTPGKWEVAYGELRVALSQPDEGPTPDGVPGCKIEDRDCPNAAACYNCGYCRDHHAYTDCPFGLGPTPEQVAALVKAAQALLSPSLCGDEHADMVKALIPFEVKR